MDEIQKKTVQLLDVSFSVPGEGQEDSQHQHHNQHQHRHQHHHVLRWLNWVTLESWDSNWILQFTFASQISRDGLWWATFLKAPLEPLNVATTTYILDANVNFKVIISPISRAALWWSTFLREACSHQN